MAKKIKKIETTLDELPFIDLLSAAGVSVENIELSVPKFKDVNKTLCKYRGFIRVLRDEESILKYIKQCQVNELVAVDTETNNSLDIHNNEMVGLCLYTPYNRPVYIPIGHKDKFTGQLIINQARKDFVKTEVIEKLKDLKLIFHNAKFDINVIRHNFGIQLPLYWDTLIAAKILNENRFSNGLKALYVEGIEPTQTDYHVTTFFEDNEHSNVEDFGLYSAIDPYDTFKVYQWQEKELRAPSMAKLRSLLIDLEFKVTEVCADMEWRGFTFDEQLCNNYIKTESAKLKEMGDKINSLLEPYKDKIIGWKDVKGGRGKVPKLDEETGLPVKKREKKVVQGKGGRTFTKWVETDEVLLVDDPYAGVKLEWPVLLTSPQQVLCLLNCILGIQINSTVVDDLKATGNEVAILIGKYRHLNHNLTSFFKPYRELAKDGKIYAHFNQMGDEDKTVKTGRFSSKEPNLQQLPARQGEDGVRMMFKAPPGKILCGCDFSAQEPRVMSSLCGERELIDGYNLRTPEFPKGKDFYAMLASSAFGKDYWECTEFDREGKFQQEGKNRRQAGKVIQLGVSYGMGVKLLIEGINAKKGPGEEKMTLEDGERMMADFFGKFKSLKAWKDYNMARLEQFGYMETAGGRRRRLYDTWLPDYEVDVRKSVPIEDIFFNIGNVLWVTDEKRSKEILAKIESEQNSFKKKDLVESLRMDPMNKIKSNGGYKSRPKTQATNFCIQGGSAELTKRAMVAIYTHPDRERLGISIVAPVHDEIIIEGNMDQREEVLKLLSTCMSNSAKGLYEVAMVCDGVIETRWNLSHFVDKLEKEYKKNPDLEALCDHYPEVAKWFVKAAALGKVDPEVDLLEPSNL